LDADREKQALEALRRGSQSEMRVLYDLHAERLFRSVLMPRLKDRGAAEDALRDTFLSALDGAKAFSGDTAFPWLATIARNKALDSLRASAARQKLSERAAVEAPGPTPPETPEETAASAEKRELARQRIEAVMQAMNARYAEAIRLRLVEERERAVCATTLGLTLGAFDVLFFRACKSFKTEYLQRFGQEP
jgi:RNA polymerase sigma factor (sigma-70 family)